MVLLRLLLMCIMCVRIFNDHHYSNWAPSKLQRIRIVLSVITGETNKQTNTSLCRGAWESHSSIAPNNPSHNIVVRC